MRPMKAAFCVIIFSAICFSSLSAQNKTVDKRVWSVPRSSPFPTVKEIPAQPIIHDEPSPTSARVMRTRTADVLVAPNVRIRPNPTTTQSEISVAVHPTNRNVLLVGSNAVHNSVSVGSQGWYYSTDGGTAWAGRDTFPTHVSFGQFLSDPAVAIDLDGRLFFHALTISTNAFIARSTNNGVNWTQTLFPGSGSSYDKNHMTIDVNPTSPYLNNVYTALTNFVGSPSPILFSRSTNNGQTFQTPVAISGTIGSQFAQGINLAVGQSGEVCAAWSGYDAFPTLTTRLGFNKSTDGGATWATPRSIRNVADLRGELNKGGNFIRVASFPSMTIDRSNGSRRGWMYIVYAERNPTQPDVVMIRSTDGGTTWSAPRKVNTDVSGKDQWLPWAAVDPTTGLLAVVYFDSRNFPANDSAQVYVSYSLDGGDTFDDVLVSDRAFLPRSISGLASGYMGDYIGITALNGSITACWNDNRNGIHQAYSGRLDILRAGTRRAISVSPDSLRFRSLFIGQAETLNVAIRNIGFPDTLTVSNISSNNSAFVPLITSMRIPGGQGRSVPVVFTSATPAGVKTGVLTIASDDSLRPTVTVQMSGVAVHPPTIAVAPDSFGFTVNEGDSTTSTMTISNNGLGPLNWTLTNEYAASVNRDDGSSLLARRILAWIPYADRSFGGEYENTLAAIRQYYTDFTLDTTSTLNPTVLASLLVGKDVFLVPEQERISDLTSVGLSFSSVLNSFVSSGRVMIVLDQSNIGATTFLNGTGLLNISSVSTFSSTTAEVFDSTTALTRNVPRQFPALNGVNSHLSSNGRKIINDQFTTRNMVTLRDVGGGSVIYFGMDFYSYNSDMARLLSNAVQYGPDNNWLVETPTSGTVPAGGNQSVQVKVRSTNLDGGTFRASILLSNNDPIRPRVSRPVRLTVIGRPNLVTSRDSLLFRDTFVNRADTLTLNITNNGSDTLRVTSIVSNNPAFTILGATAFNLGPRATRTARVRFFPTSATVFTGTLSIASNDPTDPVTTVFLRGTGVFPPHITVVPDSFALTANEGDSTSSMMTIGNTGLGPLTWQASITAGSAHAYDLPARSFAAKRVAISSQGDQRSEDVYAEAPALSAVMSNLTGKRIGIANTTSYSTLVADLRARGATVTYFSFPITQSFLDSLHALIVDDYIYSATALDVVLIRAWLQSGRGLFVQSDYSGSLPNINALLFGSGVTQTMYSFGRTGILRTIFAHPITAGVDTLYADYYSAYFAALPPAETIVRDDSLRPHVAVSTLGQGRIVAVANQVCSDYNLSVGDTRRFANQAVDWAAGITDFLVVAPTSGTVAAGSTQNVAVRARAGNLRGGTYAATIVIANNDSANNPKRVPVRFRVVGAPNVVVQDSLKFPTTYFGFPRTDTLRVRNTGSDTLIVTGISITDPAFTAAPTNFRIPPIGSRDVLVTFSPGLIGFYESPLFIRSNDPNDSVVTVRLTGFGTYPPNITVAPDSFAFTLNEGDSTTSTMTIGNTGLGPLTWQATIANRSSVQLYRLASSRVSTISGDEPNSQDSRNSSSLIPDEDILLADLTGKKIGFTFPSNYNIIVTDLQARGATIASLSFPLTQAQLDTLNVIAIDDNVGSASAADVTLIRNWIQSGKSLLIQADDQSSMTNINAILAGTGISELPYSTYYSGYLSNIVAHPITEGVDTLYASGYGSRCIVSGAAQAIVFDDSTNPHVAITTFGQGRILAVGNEAVSDFSFTTGDGRRFANQAFDWLATGAGFLSVNPTSGTVPPGSSQNVSVKARAINLIGGRYTADIVISNNDPLRNPRRVPASLRVIGVPNIVVPDSISFAATFIGTPRRDTVRVRNSGSDSLIIRDISSNNPVFQNSASSLRVPPRSERNFVLTFTPNAATTFTGGLTLRSNDADDSVHVIPLRGVGVHPPVIGVSPDSFAFTLNEGDSTTSTLVVRNTGLGSLTWQSSIVSGAGLMREFILPQMRIEQSPSLGETQNVHQETEVPLSGEVPSFSSTLLDLTGKRIGFYYSISDYGVIVSDLQTRGAIVSTIQLPITQSMLDTLDALVVDDLASSLTSTDITTIRTWLQNGKALFIDGDQILTTYNDLISGTGIMMFSGSGGIILTNIVPHPITVDVDTVGSSGYLAYSTVVSPAQTIVFDDLSRAHVAVSTLGSGRVVVAGNELMSSGNMPYGDTRRFSNQAFDWLLGAGDFISLNPTTGTVPAAGSQNVSVKVRTSSVRAGSYVSTIRLNSNDPVRPLVNVRARLRLIGTPNIVTAPDSLMFVGTFVGFADTLNLLVSNTGSDTLRVTGISSNNSLFTVAGLTTLVVPPSGSRTARIRFAPTAAGPQTGMLTIASNDPSDPTTNIRMNGVAVHPPVVGVVPDSLAFSLTIGDSSTTPMTISNTGLGPLTWTITAAISQSYIEPTKPLVKYIAVGNDDGSAVDSRMKDIAGANPRSNEGASSDEIQVARRVLAWIPYADRFPGGQYERMLSAIRLFYTDFIVDTSMTTDSTRLAAQLVGKDILIVPPQSIFDLFTQGVLFRSVVTSFVNGGRSLLVLDYGSPLGATTLLNGIGLLDIGSLSFFSDSIAVNVSDTLSQLVRNVPRTFFARGNWNSHTSASGRRIVADQVGRNVVTLREFGRGSVIYIGMNYFNFNAPMARLLSNAVQYGQSIGWLNHAPSSGTIPPGGNQIVQIKAVTRGLECGMTYRAMLQINSNDPARRRKDIPVRLRVVGTSHLVVSRDTLVFPESYVGFGDTLTLGVTNTGCDTLRITGMSSGNSQFSVIDPTVMNLPRDTSRFVRIRFAPQAAGSVNSILTIASNDSAATSRNIVLRGSAFLAPTLAFAPDSIVRSLNGSDSTTAQLKIRNMGVGQLRYKISKGVGVGAREEFFGDSTTSVTGGTARLIGDIYRATAPTVLREFRSRLTITTPTEIRFLVYESNSASGPFTRISETIITNPALGSRFHSSGNVNVSFSVNKYYYVGVAYQGTVNVSNKSVALPLPTSFGQLEASGFVASYPPPATVSPLRSTSTVWTQIILTGYNFVTAIVPDSGAINPGDSAVAIVRMRAPGLIGVYRGNLEVRTNDPLRRLAFVGTRLDVLTDVDGGDNGLPTEFALHQNYPNPFNPTTVIAYDIPTSSDVRLTLYNLLGQEIERLVDARLEAGRYKVKWEASGYATGVYLYRIEAGGFSAVKKLMIIK